MSGEEKKRDNKTEPKKEEPKGVDPAKCEELKPTPKTSTKEKLGKMKPKIALPFGKKCPEGDKDGETAPKKKYTLKDRIRDIKEGFAEIAKNRKERKAQQCQANVVGGPGVGRRMVYPYTFSAKIAQFPYRFYFNNIWFFRYFVYGTVASFPVFFWLGKKSYAPANVAEWKEKREKLFGLRHD